MVAGHDCCHRDCRRLLKAVSKEVDWDSLCPCPPKQDHDMLFSHFVSDLRPSWDGLHQVALAALGSLALESS